MVASTSAADRAQGVGLDAAPGQRDIDEIDREC